MDAFVYGTLRKPARPAAVFGHADFGPVGPTGSRDGTRRWHRAGRRPAGCCGSVTVTWPDWTPTRASPRDRYVRVRVPGETDCWTDVGTPAALGVEVRWPGEGPFSGRVRWYMATNDVRVER
jgi:hypothetical protein